MDDSNRDESAVPDGGEKVSRKDRPIYCDQPDELFRQELEAISEANQGDQRNKIDCHTRQLFDLQETIQEIEKAITKETSSREKEYSHHVVAYWRYVLTHWCCVLKQQVKGYEDQPPYLIGLALSGGGIRSATFSLGVMQRLAKAGVLQHVDYLSTVSGGGFIGSALTRWLNVEKQRIEDGEETDKGKGTDDEPSFGTSEKTFPFGVSDPNQPYGLAEEQGHRENILDYLRTHGRYLTPGNGITAWSIGAIIMRSILLNLMVWLPLATFFFWILHAAGTAPVLNGMPHLVSTVLPGALSQIVEAVGATDVKSTTGILPPVFLLMLTIAALLFVLFVVSAVNYSLLSWMAHSDPLENDPISSSALHPIFQWAIAILTGLSSLFPLFWVGHELIELSRLLSAGQSWTSETLSSASNAGFPWLSYGIWLLSVVLTCVLFGLHSQAYNLPMLAMPDRVVGFVRRWRFVALGFAALLLMRLASPAAEFLFSRLGIPTDISFFAVIMLVVVALSVLVPAIMVIDFALVRLSRSDERLLLYRLGGLARARTWTIIAIFLTIFVGVISFLPGPIDSLADAIRKSSMAAVFVAGIGFLALLNFFVGYVIRWLLRVEGISLLYGARRLFEEYFGYAICAVVLLVVIGSLPLVYTYFFEGLNGFEALFSFVVGTVSAFLGKFKSLRTDDDKQAPTIYIIASIAFVYGVLLIGYRWSVLLVDGDSQVRMVLAIAIVLAFFLGWFTNINYIGLHRFYRDRLMEAFMPDLETTGNGLSKPATRSDDFRLSSLWPNQRSSQEQNGGEEQNGRSEDLGQIPFHIINTNVVLTNSPKRKYKLRGGDNFILTPLHRGSQATGWSRAARHPEENEKDEKRFYEDGMTLATAMAISGAAFNPRTGLGGKGVTRNKFVSVVMNLLSLRLGYWVANPRLQDGEERVRVREPRTNQFYPIGCYAFSNHGYQENANTLELSDGAHFENLGLYELVRRRCGLIIVCDGSQDVSTSYADFVTAIKRLGKDLGADITIGDIQVRDAKTKKVHASSPNQLIARPSDDNYPKGAEYSTKGYFMATIEYRRSNLQSNDQQLRTWPEKGTIIYLKSSMIDCLDIVAKGYKGAHPNFPNEPTTDQFFDEEQFEAYREVGYGVAGQMIRDLGLEQLFTKDGKPRRPPLEQLRTHRSHFWRKETDSN